MTEAADAADKIMALVDEFPSEPLSFERRQIMEKITYIIGNHTMEYEGELDNSFELGRDTGRQEMSEELRENIQSLNDEIDALRQEKDEEYQKGYDDGFDTGFSQEH
jgi:flagellar biosynthesis/type III secretory pathway protein FliH